MATLIEMVAEIVTAHASSRAMSGDELLETIKKVHSTMSKLESGQPAEVATEEAKPALTVKQAFKKDEIICMICGKGKMKTLARHLKVEHGLKPGEYRKQFGIPRTQSLTAKAFSDQRRQTANERGLAQNLAKARAVRAENLKTAKTKPAKPAKPAKPVKQAKPAGKTKAAQKTA